MRIAHTITSHGSGYERSHGMTRFYAIPAYRRYSLSSHHEVLRHYIVDDRKDYRNYSALMLIPGDDDA